MPSTIAPRAPARAFASKRALDAMRKLRERCDDGRRAVRDALAASADALRGTRASAKETETAMEAFVNGAREVLTRSGDRTGVGKENERCDAATRATRQQLSRETRGRDERRTGRARWTTREGGRGMKSIVVTRGSARSVVRARGARG